MPSSQLESCLLDTQAVTVRPLDAADTAQLQDLYIHCFQSPTTGQSDQEVMNECAKKIAPYLSEADTGSIDYLAWVADVRGEAKGLLLLKTRTDTQAGRRVLSKHLTEPYSMLQLLMLDESLRGSGTAQRLFRAAEAAAKALGSQSMLLWTHSSLGPAVKFYSREGFVREVLEGQAEDDENELWNKSLVMTGA